VAQSPQGHELIEHTADVGLRVWAPTPEDLFTEAARGLVDVMGKGKGPVAHREDVRLEAPDLGALLVDWLSEVLFLFDARGVVPQQIWIGLTREPAKLEATIEGPDAEAFEQHGPAVKAVTYHDLEVKETSSGWEARVYLDV
jgi:protein archease